MIFSRNYVVRQGTTFLETILLEDIYVTLDPEETYTVEGAMINIADTEQVTAITGVLSANNTILTISIASTLTSIIENLGNYNYAIDIAASGVVQTVLEGVILVKGDFSRAT